MATSPVSAASIPSHRFGSPPLEEIPSSQHRRIQSLLNREVSYPIRRTQSTLSMQDLLSQSHNAIFASSTLYSRRLKRPSPSGSPTSVISVPMRRLSLHSYHLDSPPLDEARRLQNIQNYVHQRSDNASPAPSVLSSTNGSPRTALSSTNGSPRSQDPRVYVQFNIVIDDLDEINFNKGFMILDLIFQTNAQMKVFLSQSKTVFKENGVRVTELAANDPADCADAHSSVRFTCSLDLQKSSREVLFDEILQTFPRIHANINSAVEAAMKTAIQTALINIQDKISLEK